MTGDLGNSPESDVIDGGEGVYSLTDIRWCPGVSGIFPKMTPLMGWGGGVLAYFSWLSFVIYC